MSDGSTTPELNNRNDRLGRSMLIKMNRKLLTYTIDFRSIRDGDFLSEELGKDTCHCNSDEVVDIKSNVEKEN